ncbi:MAG: ATP-binding cassette domain-containing protein [Treponema sp.]|nr:ATP-binding cassette domain-containing protein [Treponema sp.]
MTLELRQICLHFSKKTVLNKLSLCFKEGQLHALLGENGAGKSTAANIICGELSPDSGTILLDGKPVVFRTPKDAIQNGICYVHQRPMLADYITVKENLLLGLNKEQKTQLKPQAEKWLSGVNLNSYVIKYGADIRFFIALTSALIKKPKLLVLDEPSVLLDDNQRIFLFEKLRLLAGEGMNIIIITHNYDEAEKYCDTIDYLEEGKLLKDYSPINNQQAKVHDNTGGRITLIKGLAEDGLDTLEKSLIQMRSNHEFSFKTALIPTDRKFTGSSPNLTIEQMLTSALDIPESQKPAAALKMIKSSGVDITPQEKCSSLSGGMLQKLMFERELYGNPELLILCNPLQGLDVNTCQKTCERIQKAAQNGAYILVLSYGAWPSEYCDVEYRLKDGNLEAV